jgi:hypothetical protein
MYWIGRGVCKHKEIGDEDIRSLMDELMSQAPGWKIKTTVQGLAKE